MHKQKFYNNYQVSKATKIFTANALNFNQVVGNLINGLVHKLKLKMLKYLMLTKAAFIYS